MPNTLVRTGPYRLIRHPFYLAYVLAFLAAVVVAGGVWGYVLVGSVFLLYHLAAVQEESQLSRSPMVGAEYRAYCQGTKRWCPWIW